MDSLEERDMLMDEWVVVRGRRRRDEKRVLRNTFVSIPYSLTDLR